LVGDAARNSVAAALITFLSSGLAITEKCSLCTESDQSRHESDSKRQEIRESDSITVIATAYEACQVEPPTKAVIKNNKTYFAGPVGTAPSHKNRTRSNRPAVV
jgi:hypothetical protein